MGGDEAKELYQIFFNKVQQGYQPERVKDGVFQAMMVSTVLSTITLPENTLLRINVFVLHTHYRQEVALVNDGPVTLEISTGQNVK